MGLSAVGVSFTDPRFCTSIRRVSNTSDSGNFETQEYSQLQAFSSDNMFVLLVNGNDGYAVRRVSDLSRVSGLNTAGWNAARWYMPLSHTLIHYDDNSDATLRVQTTNVDTGVTTTLFTFPSQYERIITPRSSDDLSQDGRWMAGIAQRTDGAWVIFALDLQTLTLGAQLVIDNLYTGACQPDPEWGGTPPDWVGVSPIGRYLIVQWERDGQARCSGLETFNLTTGAFVGRVADGHQHGDLGVQPDGSEFFMSYEMYHPSGNMYIGIRMLPGTATVSNPIYLIPIDWYNGGHISCKGPRGVCLVTASGDAGNGWQPYENEVFLLYTNGSIRRLAHHRSSSCGYWVQPRASFSRNGRYVIFASDWGRQINCGDYGRGDPYLIDLGTP